MRPILGLAFCLLASCTVSKSDRRHKPDVVAADAAVYAQVPSTFARTPQSEGFSLCGVEADAEPMPERRLSDIYLNNCSGCHGTAGEGRDGFPRLKGHSDSARFVEIVRRGGVSMPAFDSARFPDDVLTADFRLLAASDELTAFDSELVSSSEAATLGEEEFAAVMRSGLTAWRTPGERGACMSCHGPDAVDLARLDYPAGAILRRSHGQGLPKEMAIDIVNMVAAQRGRLGIAKPCRARLFRPLQPGGKVLDGGSTAAKEKALYDELRARDIDLSKQPVSEEEAAAYVSKIATLDVQAIPIAIGLNRWTEDSFHGDVHRSTAEWIPEIPFEASGENIAKWIGLQNAYRKRTSNRRVYL